MLHADPDSSGDNCSTRQTGRTTIILGKKDGAIAAASETSSFPNSGYEVDYYLGPGEIVEIIAEGHQTIKPEEEKMQICSFLWVYYGYPSSYYENINVDECRYRCGINGGCSYFYRGYAAGRRTLNDRSGPIGL